MRARHFVIPGLIAAYAVAGAVATPRLRHAWWYLQEDANRRFSELCALSAASAAFPWCVRYGVDACRNLRSPGLPSKVDHRVFALATGVEPSEAEAIDARSMCAGRFKAALERYGARHGGYRLWCYGRFSYCLTPPVRVEFGKVLERFSDERLFESFAASRIYSPAALFACYVGDAAAVAPAFSGLPSYGALRGALASLRMHFRPAPSGAGARVNVSRFTPFDVKFPEWLSRGGADAAVFIGFEDSYGTVQEARREALIGFDSADGGAATNAVACWANAASANPADPLLLELADALDFEARAYLAVGNANGALACYERRIEVFPRDVAAIHNFGVCLKKAGRPELAARVFARAVELDPLRDEHRLELVDCAEAGGHPDIAVRQIDVLLRRHPDDLELKKRRARILVQSYLDGKRNGGGGRGGDASPSRYLEGREGR